MNSILSTQPEALLVMQHVFARETPQSRILGGISLALNAGTYVVLTRPDSGVDMFVKIFRGDLVPYAGILRLGGKSLADQDRRRVGVLSRQPDVDLPIRVVEWIRWIGQMRGEEVPVSILQEFGLSDVLNQPMHSLSVSTARALELALIASIRNPLLLVFHEPFLDMLPEASSALQRRFEEDVFADSVVIVFTSSLDDAYRISMKMTVLENGILVGPPTVAHTDLSLWLESEETESVRQWIANLSCHPDVLALRWSTLVHNRYFVQCRTSKEEEVARAIAQWSTTTQVRVHSMSLSHSLESMKA